MANPIISEEYADIIVEDRNLTLYQGRYSVTRLGGNFSMIHVPTKEIDKCSVTRYGYQGFPFCYSEQSISSLEASGITQLQRVPNLGLFGQGVLVAIIDSGIEYTNDAFINEDRTSKIVSLWDQTLNEGGTGQEVLGYGTEFTKEMINEALSLEDPLELVPSIDETGHGTAIAGIIAGNESLVNNFRGIVPQAELVVVKLKQAKLVTRSMFVIPEDVVCYQETDIMTAVNYVTKKSIELKRPIVICIAIGSNQGSHDGRGVLSRYLGEISDIPGKSVVISAGNEGNTRRHYYGVIEPTTYTTHFEVIVAPNEPGFSMEVWKTIPDRLTIDITTPAGEYIQPIFPSNNECRVFNPIFEQTTIWVNNFLIEEQSGDQLILVRLLHPTEGIWRFRIYNLDMLPADFHVWLPADDLISENTYFLDSNPDTTITSPGNSILPITVTAYNDLNNSILSSSSRGLNRAGILKPDIAAPGVNIVCPMIGNQYGVMTGTGAAAAHTAGAVAMLMEWGVVRGNNSSIDGIEIKKMIIRGAKKSPDGTINNVWGYGMLNIYGVFERLR